MLSFPANMDVSAESVPPYDQIPFLNDAIKIEAPILVEREKWKSEYAGALLFGAFLITFIVILGSQKDGAIETDSAEKTAVQIVQQNESLAKLQNTVARIQPENIWVGPEWYSCQCRC